MSKSWAEIERDNMPGLGTPPPPPQETIDNLAEVVAGHTVELAEHATAITRALVSAPVFRFRAKAPSISGDPGPGFVRWTSTTQINSHILAIDVKDQDSLDVSSGLSVLRLGDKIYLQDFEDASNFQSWLLTAPGINRTGWWDYPVSYVTSSGTGTTNFVNGQMLAFRVTPAGPALPPEGG